MTQIEEFIGKLFGQADAVKGMTLDDAVNYCNNLVRNGDVAVGKATREAAFSEVLRELELQKCNCPFCEGEFAERYDGRWEVAHTKDCFLIRSVNDWPTPQVKNSTL